MKGVGINTYLPDSSRTYPLFEGHSSTVGGPMLLCHVFDHALSGARQFYEPAPHKWTTPSPPAITQFKVQENPKRYALCRLKGIIRNHESSAGPEAWDRMNDVTHRRVRVPRIIVRTSLLWARPRRRDQRLAEEILATSAGSMTER